jgi:hypothetical protein
MRSRVSSTGQQCVLLRHLNIVCGRMYRCLMSLNLYRNMCPVRTSLKALLNLSIYQEMADGVEVTTKRGQLAVTLRMEETNSTTVGLRIKVYKVMRSETFRLGRTYISAELCC